MLNTLCVRPRIGRRHTQCDEHIINQLVPRPHARRQRLTGLGERNAAIRGDDAEALAFQAREGFYGGDVGDAEAAGDFRGAGLAVGAHQVVDQFGVVFEKFGGAGLARAAEAECLGLGLNRVGRG